MHCTAPGCTRALHPLSASERERGTCALCWLTGLAPATRAVLANLTHTAFRHATGRATDGELDAARDEARRALDGDATATTHGGSQ